MLDDFIHTALQEDIGDGDHSSLACISPEEVGSAELEVRENGVIAGLYVAERIYELYDSGLKVEFFKQDGDSVKQGDVAFKVEGSARAILTTERLVLNVLQRMSGIATKTRALVSVISHTNAKLLDTRKTTPGIRFLEKKAVLIGGGHNHRIGLFDMIMIKDNHIDFAGGIDEAISKTRSYLSRTNKNLRIVIEVRSIDELKQVIRIGGVDRILLDNFSPQHIPEALELMPEGVEIEASGGITERNILAYAETGVDFISVGALTHSASSMDLSLKASF